MSQPMQRLDDMPVMSLAQELTVLLEASWTSPIRIYTIQVPPKGHVPVGEVFGASPSGAVLTVEATRARLALIENAEQYLKMFGLPPDGAVIVGLTSSVTPMGSVMGVLVSGTLCVPQKVLEQADDRSLEAANS